MDTLTKVQNDIDARLAEIMPAVEEYIEVGEALIALSTPTDFAPARKHKSGRPKGSTAHSLINTLNKDLHEVIG